MKTYKYIINGHEYEVAVDGIVDHVAKVTVNGESYDVKLPEPEKPAERPVVKPVTASAAQGPKRSTIKAPLPGVIIEVTVKVGDEIKRGDTVAVLEAMKMDNQLSSDRAGKVAEICVEAGQTVMEGTDLIVLE